MIHRALFLGLLLALPVRAADPSGEIIDEAMLEADFKDFWTRYEQVRKNTVPLDSFVQYYRDRSVAKGTPRQQATASFFHGLVLHNIVRNTKDSKEAKREFQRVLELYPGFLPALAELALIAELAGDRAEAERLLQVAIKRKPEYVRAWVQLAQMAQRAGDLDRAKQLYEKSFEYDMVPEAVLGLRDVNTRLYQTSFDEKLKEQLARQALALAESIVTLQPNAPKARLVRAQTLLDLGRKKEACDYLESLYASGTLKPEVEVDVLLMLRGLYQIEGNVEGVKGSIDRLLKCKSLRTEERARIAGKVKDLDAMGRWAFVKWGIEDACHILKNDGLSVEDRVQVLRRLIDFCTSEAMAIPELRPLVEQASKECFQRLTDPQPEIVLTQLRALRNGGPPPRLMSVLVHFVYPKGVTEEVREEGCRIVAAAGGVAAVPALYYSLQDDSGRVVREADAQLSLLCERRSPFGGSVEPLTPEQVREARRMWTAYFHSEEGATRLAKAFELLSACVIRVNPALTAAPMIDHAANVLLDGDVPWSGWAASYAFLVSYWGKDFRPVQRREKPVEPSEREAVTEAFEAEFNPPDPPHEPPPAKAQGNPGMKKGN